MANEEDRNREALRRDDPKQREKQRTPGQHQGGGDEHSREGKGKGTSRMPGEESGQGGREREQGGRAGQRPGSSGKGSSDSEEQQ